MWHPLFQGVRLVTWLRHRECHALSFTASRPLAQEPVHALLSTTALIENEVVPPDHTEQDQEEQCPEVCKCPRVPLPS